MINVNSFFILRCIASPVAIPLLELCTKGIKGGRSHAVQNLKRKNTDVVAKKRRQDQAAEPLFLVVLSRCFASFQAQLFVVSCPMPSCKVKA